MTNSVQFVSVKVLLKFISANVVESDLGNLSDCSLIEVSLAKPIKITQNRMTSRQNVRHSSKGIGRQPCRDRKAKQPTTVTTVTTNDNECEVK